MGINAIAPLKEIKGLPMPPADLDFELDNSAPLSLVDRKDAIKI
jgi:hypothetical protein